MEVSTKIAVKLNLQRMISQNFLFCYGVDACESW